MSRILTSCKGYLANCIGLFPSTYRNNSNNCSKTDTANNRKVVQYNVGHIKRVKVFLLAMIILTSAVVCYDPSLESIYKYFDIFCTNEVSLGLNDYSIFCRGTDVSPPPYSPSLVDNDVSMQPLAFNSKNYYILTWVDLFTCIVSVAAAVTSGLLCDRIGKLMGRR